MSNLNRTREPLLRNVIGAVLRDVRTEQGRTLREVADRARVSMPYLSEVERGRKEPSSEVLAAIAEALGMRLVDLVRRAEQLLELTARPVSVRSLTSTGTDHQRIASAPNGPAPEPVGPANGSVVALAA